MRHTERKTLRSKYNFDRINEQERNKNYKKNRLRKKEKKSHGKKLSIKQQSLGELRI
jgi:hypothetical protein